MFIFQAPQSPSPHDGFLGPSIASPSATPRLIEHPFDDTEEYSRWVNADRRRAMGEITFSLETTGGAVSISVKRKRVPDVVRKDRRDEASPRYEHGQSTWRRCTQEERERLAKDPQVYNIVDWSESSVVAVQVASVPQSDKVLIEHGGPVVTRRSSGKKMRILNKLLTITVEDVLWKIILFFWRHSKSLFDCGPAVDAPIVVRRSSRGKTSRFFNKMLTMRVEDVFFMTLPFFQRHSRNLVKWRPAFRTKKSSSLTRAKSPKSDVFGPVVYVGGSQMVGSDGSTLPVPTPSEQAIATTESTLVPLPPTETSFIVTSLNADLTSITMVPFNESLLASIKPLNMPQVADAVPMSVDENVDPLMAVDKLEMALNVSARSSDETMALDPAGDATPLGWDVGLGATSTWSAVSFQDVQMGSDTVEVGLVDVGPWMVDSLCGVAVPQHPITPGFSFLDESQSSEFSSLPPVAPPQTGAPAPSWTNVSRAIKDLDLSVPFKLDGLDEMEASQYPMPEPSFPSPPSQWCPMPHAPYCPIPRILFDLPMVASTLWFELPPRAWYEARPSTPSPSPSPCGLDVNADESSSADSSIPDVDLFVEDEDDEDARRVEALWDKLSGSA
ncbi:hypothetical protein B0H21DRAFT_464462 [Amylocystis lapponica]|nr:hypothetical protein B0H21DRAFT_464462 [Amylocystis lapponica]